MLVHRRVTPSIKFAGTHLYNWVERGTESKVSCPRTLMTQCPWLDLESGLLDPEMSILGLLTMTPSRLPELSRNDN